MRSVIAIMFMCFLSAACVAQDEEAPKKLVGFLKPGTYIGISSYQDSDRITINIYTEQDHAIAIDARRLSLDELASKYERVATGLEQTRKDFLQSLPSRTEDLPPGKEFGEPKSRLNLNPRESFFKIVATGDDYILVSSPSAPTKRRVFATRFISSIGWREELEFSASVDYVDKASDKTKR
jgi:hypothetical protein